MKELYLLNYAVRGIKNIDKWVELSFYKKGITSDFSIKGYNVKGIYGANGSGKTALVSAMKILKNLIMSSTYLNSPYVQKQLGELINKKLGMLDIRVDYLVVLNKKKTIYRYQISILKGEDSRFQIKSEALSVRSALVHSESMSMLYLIEDGMIKELNLDPSHKQEVYDFTKNLLPYSSFSTILVKKMQEKKGHLESIKSYLEQDLFKDTLLLYMFGRQINTYMDLEDEHEDYFIYDEPFFRYGDLSNEKQMEIRMLLSSAVDIKNINNYVLTPGTITVFLEDYPSFMNEIHRLTQFLKVFKSGLQDIIVEKRDEKSFYVCRLLMVYPDYRIDAEFESTGIKKLIRLYSLIEKMVNGDIVFIDEMDSNLHDVYLCALLDYLMEYGKGQLCFTTHNVGPMDVLKKNKKAIDFLSVDHEVYSWSTKGNYSPSKLYRSGMIEGSPFNIDSVDFIGIFEKEEG